MLRLEDGEDWRVAPNHGGSELMAVVVVVVVVDDDKANVADAHCCLKDWPADAAAGAGVDNRPLMGAAVSLPSNSSRRTNAL